MVHADIESVVALHRICFPDYFVTELGPRFLRLYYGETLDEIALVAVDEDRGLLGFHLSFARPGRTFTRLLVRRGPVFLLAALPTAIRGLRQARRVAGAVFKPAQARLPEGSAICMYTAVSPDARGRGVARQLLMAMRAAAIHRGLVAMVGENEDEERLCALYESIGFCRVGTFIASDGAPRIRMLMDLRGLQGAV